jgi:hypothetical protein
VRRGYRRFDLHIGEPVRQSRWKTAFRLVLAVPALLVVVRSPQQENQEKDQQQDHERD